MIHYSYIVIWAYTAMSLRSRLALRLLEVSRTHDLPGVSLIIHLEKYRYWITYKGSFSSR